jgi:acyl dehydratase
MPPRKLYFETTRIGDEIPAMAKAPIDRVQLARYAGATGDFNPVYVDEAFAKSLGMPSVLAPTSLGLGFLSQLVTDWARGAHVKRMSVKFVRTVWPGDTLVCKGRVSDRHSQDGRYFLELDVWAENQKGELVIKGQVSLKVFYSIEDETRFRTGQPPLVVNVARESILTPPPLAHAAPLRAKPRAAPAPAPAPKKLPSRTPAKPAKASKPAKVRPAKKAARRR